MTASDYRAQFWRALIPGVALFWILCIGLTVHFLFEHSRAKRLERVVATHLEHRSHFETCGEPGDLQQRLTSLAPTLQLCIEFGIKR